MKFSKSVVVIAWALIAFNVSAETDAPSATAAAAPTATAAAAPSATAAATPAATVSVSTTINSKESTNAGAAAVAPTVAPAPAAPAPAPVIGADSKAEALKKVRQEVEQKNDSKVVEKLEKTRLEDEKDLAEKIDTTSLKSEPAKQEAPAVKIEKVEILQEPVVKAEEKKEDKKQDRSWYGGVGLGKTIYPGNVINNSNFTILIGTNIDDHMAVEGSLNIASFTLNNYWGGGALNNGLFDDMDQYDGAFALKYFILEGDRFRPYVGASGDYIYRKYKNRDYGSNFYYYDNYTTEQTTNSLNASIIGGVDVKLSERLSVNGEFKYSMPIYRQDNGLITQIICNGLCETAGRKYFH